MSIYPGQVLVSCVKESPLPGLHRVIQIREEEDKKLVVLIEIPGGPRKNENAKQNNYYARGFFTRTYEQLTGWKSQKLIRETELELPPLWNMPDNKIREKYPPRKGGTESHPIATRKYRCELIKPLLPDQADNSVFNFMELDKKACLLAVESKVSRGMILDAVHRYYAFGSVENALLPNTFGCGAPDTPRVAKNGKKLGRRNAAAKVGNAELQGKILTEEDRQNMGDGWSLLVRPGTTVDEAFLGMTTMFYSTKITMKHGVMVPELLNANERPTIREFRYHGPRGQKDSALRRLMGEGEWSKNQRELHGTVRSGVLAFGQVGSIDASPIDLNECFIGDRLRPIGVGRAIVVKDVNYDLYVGWHIANGGIGVDEANLAILNAALDKSELLKRHGLEELPAEDFPFVFFSKILSDNGELRCIKGLNVSVEKLGSRIEFVKANGPDRNSSSESGHHVKHRGLDHKLKGTNKGRQKKRGETPPITNAIFTSHEYNRLFIQWIHYMNTQQQVPHLLTTEMRRDNVKPTRIEMYRWALKKGYIAGKPVDRTHLKAHLLPTFTASVRRNGLFLHRPKNGNAVELLKGARFSDPYLASSGLIRDALNGGKRHVDVKADPDDLSKVYLIDMKGIHVIPNKSDDLILIREGCISDLCAMNDVDRQRAVENASQTDQDEVDIRSYRVEQEEQSSNAKKAAQAKAKNNPKPKTDKSSVRKNQEDERRTRLDEAVKRAGGHHEEVHGGSKTNSTKARDELDASESPRQPNGCDMTAILRERLRNFHQQRGVQK